MTEILQTETAIASEVISWKNSAQSLDAWSAGTLKSLPSDLLHHFFFPPHTSFKNTEASNMLLSCKKTPPMTDLEITITNAKHYLSNQIHGWEGWRMTSNHERIITQKNLSHFQRIQSDCQSREPKFLALKEISKAVKIQQAAVL